jgi:WD40 repeat protein
VWATHSCPLTHGTAAAHAAAAADGAAVTCHDRSSTVLGANTTATPTAANASATASAAGDSYGRIRLFCFCGGASQSADVAATLYHELTGHAGPVGRVCFLSGLPGTLVTVGQSDGCTLQWSVKRGEAVSSASTGTAAVVVDSEALVRYVSKCIACTSLHVLRSYTSELKLTHSSIVKRMCRC